jgi:hypothetical protein
MSKQALQISGHFFSEIARDYFKNKKLGIPGKKVLVN